MSFGNRRESSIKSFVLSLQSSVSSKQPNMHVLQLLQCSKTIHKPIIHKSLHSSLPSPFNALSLPFAINHHSTQDIMLSKVKHILILHLSPPASHSKQTLQVHLQERTGRVNGQWHSLANDWGPTHFIILYSFLLSCCPQLGPWLPKPSFSSSSCFSLHRQVTRAFHPLVL